MKPFTSLEITLKKPLTHNIQKKTAINAFGKATETNWSMICSAIAATYDISGPEW